MEPDGPQAIRVKLEAALKTTLGDTPADLHAAIEWDPAIFPAGETDPEFNADECFVLAVGNSLTTIPARDFRGLLCWFASRLQDAMIDRDGRPWPEVDGVVLDAMVAPGVGPVWSDLSGRVRIPIGELRTGRN